MTYKDKEIENLIEDQKRLPSTHRHGYGSRRDDVAEELDGTPASVPTPETPDDRFE